MIILVMGMSVTGCLGGFGQIRPDVCALLDVVTVTSKEVETVSLETLLTIENNNIVIEESCD